MRTTVALLAVAMVVACTPAQRDAEPGSPPEVAPVAPEPADTLGTVRDRGRLRCGTDSEGFWSAGGLGGGFADDLCRVIAAAVLGAADAVERVTITDGVAALHAGDVDVVVTLSWSASRDGSGQVAFTTPLFFDGTGIMTRAGAAGELRGLADAVVCAPESRLPPQATHRLERLGAATVTFADEGQVAAAFRARACDAWADDVTRLASARLDHVEAGELAIVGSQLTLRPLAPAVAEGDPAWRDAVTWALLATLIAEEAGLDARAVADRAGTDDPDVRRLLGLRVDEPGEPMPVRYNPGLGLPADVVARVVGQVGNYAEIHARHLGALGLPRAATALAGDGGLLHPPPYW